MCNIIKQYLLFPHTKLDVLRYVAGTLTQIHNYHEVHIIRSIYETTTKP